MPELPEVETMRRGVLPIIGARVRAVDQPPSRLHPITIRPTLPALRRRIVGRQINDIVRIGKRVVLLFDSGDSLVIEPRMTGLVLLADPPDQEHLRLQIALSGSQAERLWFWDRRGLGVVQLLAADERDRLLGPERLGPDALQLTVDVLRARLAHSRRPIKVALLDQRAVAGIGNLYASEILHLARLDPRIACQRLNHAQWRRLLAAIDEVLRQAILYEGSTLSDGTYRNALNKSGRYQSHHRVYARAGEPCLSCTRAAVQRIVQAQRSTFFCPHCQKLPRPRQHDEMSAHPAKSP